MAKIRFENGTVVNFEGNPTPQDVEEVASKLGISKTPEPKKKTLAGKIFKGAVLDPIESLLIKPAVRTGQAIGRAGIEVFGTEAMKNKADSMMTQDTKFGPFNVEGIKEGKAGYKQIAGEGLESAANIATLVGAPKVAGAVKPALSFGKGFVKGALSAAPKGAAIGALHGTAGGLKEDRSATDIAGQGLLGGLTGGAVAGLVGGIGGGISGALRGRALRKAELSKLLADDGHPITQKLQARDPRLPLADVAKTDPSIKEAAFNGVDEGQALFTKASSKADKLKMGKMLDIARKGQGNPVAMERATDVAGESFVKRVGAVRNVLTKAGNQLDEVADTTLKGGHADFIEPLSNFNRELKNAGVSIGRGGQLNFKGSDFEAIPSAQKALQNGYQRLLDVGEDALKAHRFKQFMYNTLDYAKSGEGITGNAERILKQAVGQTDEVLDNMFPAYNQANQLYGEAKNILTDTSKFVGKNLLKGDFGSVKAGTALRALLSNRLVRSDQLQLLNNMEDLLAKQGYKTNESIVSQVVFADMMEDLFGTPAKTGFQGGIEKAGEKLLEKAGENVTFAGLAKEGLKKGYDFLTQKNRDTLIESIKGLLK